MKEKVENHLHHFKDHVATFSDYGNIKILDFKKPNSNAYRIRFLFEEDYKRLHISGDLGELIAIDYNNMCFDGFEDFVNNTDYFEEKVLCHNRPFHYYDEKSAREKVKEYIEKYLYLERFDEYCDWQSEEENMNDILDSIFDDFTQEKGIGSKGWDILTSQADSEVYYDLSEAGKQNTIILELYMQAFKLAMKHYRKMVM